MASQILIVRVVTSPSLAAIRRGAPAKGKVRVLHGLPGTPEYQFVAPSLQAAKLLRKGIIAAVRASLAAEENRVVLKIETAGEAQLGSGEFCILPDGKVLEEIADATGVYVSADEYTRCLRALGAIGLAFCDRRDFERLAAEVGDELADRFMRLAFWERKWGADMLEGLFSMCDLQIDRPLIWQAAKALRFRAARRKVSVFDLVAENPYILVQVWDDSSSAFSAAEVIWECLRGPLTRLDHLEHKAAAAAVEYVKREMEHGNSFAWANRVHKSMFDTISPLAGDATEEALAGAWGLLGSRTRTRLHGGLVTEKDGTRISLRQVAVDSGCYPRDGWTPDDNATKLRAVYAPGIYWSERRASEMLVAQSLASARLALDPESLVGAAAAAASREGRGLDPEQEEFIRAVASRKVVVLTGEAGTGKTQALKWLSEAVRSVVPGYVPLVLAPTGAAAYRAAEKIAGQGMTIHRYAAIFEEDADLFVEPEPSANGGPESPGVLIVDECSMLGPAVLYRLLAKVSPDTRIVFAGDPEQLPAVGPAGTFHALVRLADEGVAGFAHVRLLVNHRAAAGSGVYAGAREIREGRPLPDGLPGVEVRVVSSSKRWFDECCAAVADLVGDTWPADPGQLMVLTPYRENSPVNTERLNGFLGARFGLLPDGSDGSCVPVPGMPVVCRRNDYADGGGMAPDEVRQYRHPERRTNIFNGTPGIVLEVRRNGRTEILVRYRMGDSCVDAWYTEREFPYWTEKAYALTVHKAQGGQAKNVVLVLPTPGSAANRRLIYTALSRCHDDPPGSGRVIIVTCPEFLDAPYAEKTPEEALTGGVLCGLYYRVLDVFRRVPAPSPLVPEVTDSTPDWWVV